MKIIKRNSIYARNIFRPSIFLAIALVFTFCTRPVQISQEVYDNIQEGFIALADTNKPWCYYYWIGDDISKEGITKDLEAMKELSENTLCLCDRQRMDPGSGPPQSLCSQVQKGAI